MYTYVNGFGPHLAAFEDFRRQFDSIFNGVGFERARATATPFVDTGAAYVLTAELPGLSHDDIELTVTGDEFELSARREPVVPEGFEAHRRERKTISVRRTGRFPALVDVEAVTASFDNGLLTVTFPKAPEARPRRIEVKVG
jgi:HSP20 family protein